MKRILLLNIIFLFSITTFAKFIGAKSDEQGVVYVANEDGTTCYVLGHEENYNAEIVIPESFEGLSVTSIGRWAFRDCSTLTSVTIPNSVTSIGVSALEGCSGLTSITIPNSVTSIGREAFRDCSGLTSITIPNSVTSIGYWVFWGCIGLTSITIPNSVTSIGEAAFEGCSGLTSITIPNSVTSIGNAAFDNCSGLTSVTIPNSVTSIGDGAFYGCSGLTSVTIPNSVTSIGHSAFEKCSGLTSITIPNSITSIGDWVFWGCSGLTSITIPNSVTSIGRAAFEGCSGLTSITIPNSVTSIRECAFYGCSSLTSVTIPNSVTSIEYSAFEGCSGLTSINIPNSVTRIGDGAFSGCSSLTSVTIPNSVTSIERGAFEKCSSLTKVSIGSGIKSIGGAAFNDCSSLEKVIIKDIAAWCSADLELDDLYASETYYASSNPLVYAHHLYRDENTEITDLVIPEGVTSINCIAFIGCTSLKSVTIPSSVKTIEGYSDRTQIGLASPFDGCTSLNAVHISDLEAWCRIKIFSVYPYTIEENYNSNPLNNAGHLFLNGKEVKDLVIPTSVTSIGEAAFSGCSGLTSVTIPNSVKSIGEAAFYRCRNLTSVSIGNSVASVGRNAFSGCSSLTSVTFHCREIKQWFEQMISIKEIVIGDEVEIIGNGAFYGCSGLTSVTIGNSVANLGKNTFYGCGGLASVTIPNSVTSIGEYAFYDCSSLTEVTIPNSVTSIGNYAFSVCSGLTKVISLIEEPFDIETSVWNRVNTDEIPLYVPAGTKEKYEATEGWNVFTNIIEMGIAPSEGEDINYGGSEISGETNLNGNVVGNIYYNIGDENGEYSSAEGCITLRTPVSDEQMSQVEGMDLFGEDMKNNFTGIIFMVQAGSGTIKVNAETTGNMTLKVKVGSSKPMTFRLNGRLDAELPYEVSEPTYVYIYGGGSSAAGARGVRKAAGDGEVKIYGISWTSGTDGIKTIDNVQSSMFNVQSPIYNLNGQRVISSPLGRSGGVPTKGIYIKNGRKIVVRGK